MRRKINSFAGSFLLLFICHNLSATIAVDASTQSSTASGSSLTWSHTCTGTNRVLIVNVVYSSSNSISSVTYNGTAMTISSTVGNGTHARSWCRLTSPATGANNIVVTMSGTSIVIGGAISFTGNDNSSINGLGTSSGTSATPSTTQAVTAGEMVVDAISTNDQLITTVGALQTERVNITETFSLAMSTEPEAGSSPLTMSWTFAASDAYIHSKWWLNVGSALPVILYSFFADCNNQKQVEVSWTTGSEINNDYFTVERSSDGIRFEHLTQVTGAGNSNTPQHYQVADENPFRGTSYYRLKQTDFDGKSEQFPMAPVRDCDEEAEKLNVMLISDPNSKRKTILYRLANGGKLSIEWYNTLGEAIKPTEILYQPEGAFEYPVQLDGTTPGMYIGVFRLDDEVKFCKVVW